VQVEVKLKDRKNEAKKTKEVKIAEAETILRTQMTMKERHIR
jgi:hypothetical protein